MNVVVVISIHKNQRQGVGVFPIENFSFSGFNHRMVTGYLRLAFMNDNVGEVLTAVARFFIHFYVDISNFTKLPFGNGHGGFYLGYIATYIYSNILQPRNHVIDKITSNATE